MKYTEVAVSFECESEWLLGILAQPAQPSDTGVVIIVGGPQYRAGSHRQFVLLSRALAQAGFAVLRFDYRGMGDSEGQQRDFLAVSEDVGTAISAFRQRLPAVSRVVLWGLCDGASAALLYWHASRDARVAGLCLLNPWVRSNASLARTQVKHYYTKRLMQGAFWVKLIRGGVARDAIAGFWTKLRAALASRAASEAATEGHVGTDTAFQSRMAIAWKAFDGALCLVLSGDDYTAKEFLEFTAADSSWANAFNQPRMTRHDLTGADHTFSDIATHQLATRHTIDWLKTLANQH